jgi:hypothetical protein
MVAFDFLQELNRRLFFVINVLVEQHAGFFIFKVGIGQSDAAIGQGYRGIAEPEAQQVDVDLPGSFFKQVIQFLI